MKRVVIIGNPEGAGLKVSEGMITDLSVKVTNLRIPLLEITADLHPGNSGSPVLDAQGRVIGIISVKIEKKAGSNVEIPLGGASRQFAQGNPALNKQKSVIFLYDKNR